MVEEKRQAIGIIQMHGKAQKTILTLDHLGRKASDEIKHGDNSNAVAEQASEVAEQHYLKAGKILLEAKKQVKHGEWLPWLKKYGIAERTAQMSMAIASARTKSKKIREQGKEASQKYRDKNASRHADSKSPAEVRASLRQLKKEAFEVASQDWQGESDDADNTIISKIQTLAKLVAELASDVRDSESLPLTFETEIRNLTNGLLALVSRGVKT